MIGRQLLGVPWSDADCRQMALRTLDALGIEVPGREAWEAPSLADSETGFEAYLSQEAGAWERLCGHCERVPWDLQLREGDVVVSRARVLDGAAPWPHLSVVVDADARVAVSTSKRMGSMALRVAFIIDVRGVWRRRR